MLRVKNAFACTLLDVDLKFNPRLKKKILGSFEKYKKETETLLMRLKLKNKDLQDELEDQNDEVRRLKTELAKEQGEFGKDPKELEATRKTNIDLKTQLEETKRVEEIMKLQLEEKEKTNQKLEMEVVSLRKKIEKSNNHVKFNSSSVILDKILDFQRSPFDKSALGYKNEEDKYEGGTWSPKTLEEGPSSSKGKDKVSPHAPVHDNKEFGR